MSKRLVLVSAEMSFRGKEPAREILENAGLEIVERPGQDLREKLVGVSGILAGGERLNAETMADAHDLRVVARNGVGFDAVDLVECTARGIVVTTTPGTLSDAVADHAMALLLAVVRHISTGDRAVKRGEYDVPYGEDLASMTLGMIGCGHIGTEMVRRALAFKMRVVVCDPHVEPARLEALGAIPVSLEELQQQADAISLHLPLSEESESLVNAEFLSRMKPGSVLVNTARGKIVDDAALMEALKSGHLAGAGLDCQESEPPQGVSLELVQLDQVVAMPHSGSKTITAREQMSVMAAQSMADGLHGKLPVFSVNPEVFDKLDLK